jgi:arsenate reductase
MARGRCSAYDHKACHVRPTLEVLRTAGEVYSAHVADDVVVWYNPRCSKCQGAEELLAAHGVSWRRLRYLDDPPARDEIVQVLALLGTTDPRAMMRMQEARYVEMGLAQACDDRLLDAMAAYPELIERPIVIRPDRAIVARPPELLLSLLGT